MSRHPITVSFLGALWVAALLTPFLLFKLVTVFILLDRQAVRGANSPVEMCQEKKLVRPPLTSI
jgi:hypothetical protein